MVWDASLEVSASLGLGVGTEKEKGKKKSKLEYGVELEVSGRYGRGEISTQTITVDDTMPPVLAGCPDDLTVECMSDVPPPATVSATDNCIQDLDVGLDEVIDGQRRQRAPAASTTLGSRKLPRADS